MTSSFFSWKAWNEMGGSQAKPKAAFASELSPARRASIQLWLEDIPESHIGDNDLVEPLTDSTRGRGTESPVDAADQIYPDSSPSNDQTSPGPSLLYLPLETDHKALASANTHIFPMDRIDLLESPDTDILQKKDQILKDYTRHLVRSAMKSNQNPDIHVDQVSLQLEPEYRMHPTKVLRQILLTLVREMDDSDREVVEIVMHTRGVCQSRECFMCQTSKR